jgi:hypothetical protein
MSERRVRHRPNLLSAEGDRCLSPEDPFDTGRTSARRWPLGRQGSKNCASENRTFKLDWMTVRNGPSFRVQKSDRAAISAAQRSRT